MTGFVRSLSLSRRILRGVVVARVRMPLFRMPLHRMPLVVAASAGLCVAACQSDEGAKSADPSPKAAEPAPPPTEAPSPEAPSPEAPSPEAAEPTATPPADAKPIADLRDPQAFIFNRVLVKFVDPPKKDPEALAALEKTIEEKTGAKVESLHFGPLQTGVIIFAPTTPPRLEDDQSTLARAVAGIQLFAYAEADRLRGPR